VLCWCGWQTVGSAADENRFTVCEEPRRVCYGAVFKGKKEILAYRLVGKSKWKFQIRLGVHKAPSGT